MFQAKANKLGVCMTLAILAVMGGALAEDSTSATMATIRTATVAQLTTVQQALLGMISDILPVALVVFGSIMVVTLGVRFFRRFAG